MLLSLIVPHSKQICVVGIFINKEQNVVKKYLIKINITRKFILVRCKMRLKTA